jgi:hypothetical protein
MNKLLVLLFLSGSTISFSQVEWRGDLVNKTNVQYSVLEMDVDNPNLKELKVLRYIEIIGNEWKGASKINALIKKEASALSSKQFAQRFQKEYDLAIKKTLKEWYNGCVEDSAAADADEYDCGHYSDYKDIYTLDGLWSEFEIVSICDNILIGGMHTSFDAARDSWQLSIDNLSFQDLHYYDLDKGVEIEPSTILNKKKKREFERLLRRSIPEHLSEIADTLDFSKGFPIFNGASFYYFINGNIEADNDYQIILQPRLSFDEALPFLNPNGPFKAYLKVEKKNPIYNGLAYNETRYYDYHCSREIEALESLGRYISSLSGELYTGQHLRVSHGESGYELNVQFNKKGSLVNHKYYSSEEGLADDSVVFEYHPNGMLKMIRRYEVESIHDNKSGDEYDKFFLTKLYEFDELENLIKRTIYDIHTFGFIEVTAETEYFTYFANRVITDLGAQTSSSTGFIYEVSESEIIEGSLEFICLDYDQSRSRYSIQHFGNETKLLHHLPEGDTVKMNYFTENNQIKEFYESYGQTKIQVTYDDDQRPILFEKFRANKTGYGYVMKSELEYDSFGRPSSFTSYMFSSDHSVHSFQVNVFHWE